MTKQSNENCESLKKTATPTPTLELLQSKTSQPRAQMAQEKREKSIDIRLNRAEKELLKRKAAKANLKPSTFIRCLISGSDYDPKLREALLSANRELTAQGRDLNHIKKSVSEGLVTTSQDLVRMFEALRGPLVQSLRAIKSALIQGAAPQP